MLSRFWSNYLTRTAGQAMCLTKSRSAVGAMCLTSSRALQIRRSQSTLTLHPEYMRTVAKQFQLCPATNLLYINKENGSRGVRFLSHQFSPKNDDKCALESKDVTELIDDLIRKASERDVMVKTIGKNSLIEYIQQLRRSGFEDAEFDILAKQPKVFHNIVEFCSVVQYLQELGVEKHDWINMFKTFPNIFSIFKSDLTKTVENLYSVGFKTENMHVLLTQCPSILDADISSIEQRVTDLKTLFKTSDTFKLLCKTPELLFCDLAEIEDKFHYVYQVMGITQPQMLYSSLFSYPLEHIHARHMFALRAGFFKKTKRQKGQIDLNPKLDTLLDSADENFAQMFGNMTVEDYHCFKKLLLLENRRAKNVDENDDD